MAVRSTGTWMCAALMTWLTLPSEAIAGHCEYCNEGLPSSVDISPAVLPTDGVLMISLQDARARVLSHDWWEMVIVQVMDTDGAIVPGDLKIRAGVTPALWTPERDWPEGPLQVRVAVELEGDCAWERTSEVLVDASVAAPSFPEIEIDEVYRADADDELDNLVCCDGAAPWEASAPGIICPGYSGHVVEHRGFCTQLRAFGRTTVTARLTEAEPSRFTIRERVFDSRPAYDPLQVDLSLSSPACLEFEVLNVVSGATQTQEHCVEEQPSQPLGEFERAEVADEIEASCSGPGYVCEGDSEWRLFKDCSLWPEGPALDPDLEADTDPDAGEAEHEASGCNLGRSRRPSFTMLWLIVVGAGAVLRRMTLRASGTS